MKSQPLSPLVPSSDQRAPSARKPEPKLVSSNTKSEDVKVVYPLDEQAQRPQ